MSLKNTFKIIPELDLIIFSWIGTATFESWLEQKKKIIAHKDFQPNLKSIQDICNLTFKVSIEDIKKYIAFALKNKNDSQKKTAILTCTPNQVATSTLFEQLKGDELCKTIICSTISCAIKWLEIPNNEKQKIIDILEILRNELQNNN